MSDEDRRSFENLMLLCLVHADEVDQPALIAEYTVEVLEGWKQRQTKVGTSGGTELVDELLDRAIHLSEVSIFQFRDSTLSLGGEGGRAPGSGGGGGGAIGPGARGGDGGPGGDQAHLVVTGADVMGKVPLVVGQGARPGVLGMPGECGGHTSFGAFVVHGGGREIHTVHAADVKGVSETRIVAAVLANHVELHNGLAYLAGAGWDYYWLSELPGPFAAGLCVWVELELSGADSDAPIPVEVIAELLTPTDHVTFSERVLYEASLGRTDGIARIPIAIGLRGTLHDQGDHILHLSCNDEAHVDVALEVRLLES